MVEGIAIVLHPTDDNSEDAIIQMVNETIQYTQMLPQLMHQIQQMQTIMAQMQTKLNNTNKNGGNDNNTSGGNKNKKGPILGEILLMYSWCMQSPGSSFSLQGRSTQIQ